MQIVRWVRHKLCQGELHGGIYAERDELMRLPDFLCQRFSRDGIPYLPACGVKGFSKRKDRNTLRSKTRKFQHTLMGDLVKNNSFIDFVTQHQDAMLQRYFLQRLEILFTQDRPARVVGCVDHDHPGAGGDPGFHYIPVDGKRWWTQGDMNG